MMLTPRKRIEKLEKRYEKLGRKYEKVSPFAKLVRLKYQYKMVKILRRIERLQAVEEKCK